jgi:hypothetical protein
MWVFYFYMIDSINNHMKLNEITNTEKYKNHISKSGNMYLDNHRLEDLKGIHESIPSHNHDIVITSKLLKSNILGLLLIKNLKYVKFEEQSFSRSPSFKFINISNIINKYLPNPNNDFSNVVKCAKELRDAGFHEYAKL